MKFFKKIGIVILLLSNSSCAEHLDAENAIRWKSFQSPLPTIKMVQEALNISAESSKKSKFTIQLYTITKPEDVPEGATVIARSRVETKSSGKVEFELTIKYRSEKAITIDPKSWVCPLGSENIHKKYEVDISFGLLSKTQKRYSLSCSLESKTKIEFPAHLKAVKFESEKSMVRFKYEDITIEGKLIKVLKIEEWKIGNPDQYLIEVSMPGVDNAENMALFNEKVVSKLLGFGISPDIENKSILPK